MEYTLGLNVISCDWLLDLKSVFGALLMNNCCDQFFNKSPVGFTLVFYNLNTVLHVTWH